MLYIVRKGVSFFSVLLFLLFWEGTALATQAHGGREGLYSHLIAHLVFLTATIYFCIRLIRSKEMLGKGWRYIFFSALFFALWNVQTFFVHTYREFLDSQAYSGKLYGFSRTFHAQSILDVLYYLGRFDHVLSLPALILLLLGIRLLLKRQEEPA